MKKKLFIAIAATVSVTLFFACGQKKTGEENNAAKEAVQPMVPNAPLQPAAPQEDGKLYKGNANFAETQAFEVNFELSADKKEIRNLTLIITGLQVSASYGNSRIEQTGGKSTTSYSMTYPVQNNKANISLGKNGTLKIAFDDTGATGTIAYTYVIESSEGHPDIPVDFGTSAIRFQAQ